MKPLQSFLSMAFAAFILIAMSNQASYADFPNIPNSTFNEAIRVTNPMHVPFLYNPLTYHDVRQSVVNPHTPKENSRLSINGNGVNTNIAEGTDMIRTDDGKILITANIPVNLVKELPQPFDDKKGEFWATNTEDLPVILLFLQEKQNAKK